MEIQQYYQALQQAFKRRVHEESISRIHYCLDQLSLEEIWHQPNPASNSVGNLILHLCGNARQWIVSGLGGVKDTRNRDLEFSKHHSISVEELKSLLQETWAAVEETIDDFPAERLFDTYLVQGFEESGLSILIHVIEHFSYHTGQITYFVKAHKNINTGYYTGIDLNKRK